jgi:hypothetical protein
MNTPNPRTSFSSRVRARTEIARRVLAAAAVALLLAPVASTQTGCDTYYAPPSVDIDGLEQGVLHDPGAPIVLDFGKPIQPDTLRFEIIKYEADDLGNLPDERGDDSVSLRSIYAYDAVEGTERGGRSALSDDGTQFVITPQARMPVGTKLALVVEPGLKSTHGEDTRVRHRVLFGYDFSCKNGKGTKLVPSGVYFALLEVEKPVGAQVQLYANLQIDPVTGLFRGQFTNADRSTTQKCPSSCSSAQVCRLLPSPACVAPSTRAGSVDEFPDYVPNDAPPTGYSFTVTGCIEDQTDGTAAFLSAPATMVVTQPAVTIEALVMTAAFEKDKSGVLRASGSVTGDEVLLGQGPLGPGSGTITVRALDQKIVPPGVPAPPAASQ